MSSKKVLPTIQDVQLYYVSPTSSQFRIRAQVWHPECTIDYTRWYHQEDYKELMKMILNMAHKTIAGGDSLATPHRDE